MKKLVLVCAFVIGVSAVSFAQGGGHRRTPKEQVEQLKKNRRLMMTRLQNLPLFIQTLLKNVIA
jgi:protein CpxP